MSPDTPQNNFELPAPVTDGGEDTSPSYEQVPSRPETTPAPARPSTPSPAQAHPAPQAVPMAPPVSLQPVSAPANSPSPLSADDNDLIEEEWVIKAKQIIAATREDPHAQTREVTKFKADYLKKRYNKDLRLEES